MSINSGNKPMADLPSPDWEKSQRLDPLAGVKEIVGRNIERLIESTSGMNQTKLATLLGTGPSNVSRWIKGKALPDADNIDAIAKLFDISISALFSEPQTDFKRPVTKEDALRILASSEGYMLKKIKK